MSVMSLMCAGMVFNSFLRRMSKIVMRLFLPATAISKLLGLKSLQRMELDCLISQMPFPVLRSHIIPNPPRSPVKYSDWSECRLPVCISFSCPFCTSTLDSLRASHSDQLWSYDPVKKWVPPSIKLILLILSECPSFTIAFCSFKSLTNDQAAISPLVVPVIMLGAPPGMLPMRGLMASPHILAVALSVDISVQKSVARGSGVFQILPSPLEPTVTKRSPLDEKTPLVTELASPYSVATFSKRISLARAWLKSSSACSVSPLVASFSRNTRSMLLRRLNTVIFALSCLRSLQASSLARAARSNLGRLAGCSCCGFYVFINYKS